jgi:hypothetical protein
LGRLGPRQRAIDQRIRTLTSNATPLGFVDDAGPCGSGLERALSRTQLQGWGVAPSLVPKHAGDRLKTARRDATPLARLRRSGELAPVEVPTVADEASRDLAHVRLGTRVRHRTARGTPAWDRRVAVPF